MVADSDAEDASAVPEQAPADRPRWTLRSLARRLIILSSIAVIVSVALLMAFAWLLPQDFTNMRGWYLRLVTIAFFARVFQLYAGVVTLVAAVLAMLARARRVAIAGAVIGIVLLAPFVAEYIPRSPPPPAGPTFTLMAINVYFKNHDERAIIEAIDTYDPDVIVVEEVTDWVWWQIIQGHLRERYPHILQGGVDGAAMALSRLPARFEPPQPRGARQRPEIRRPLLVSFQGREIALFPVHLVSPGNVGLIASNRMQVREYARIVSSREAGVPTIVAGDFNVTPLSANYLLLKRAGLRSTHELAGYGLGNTWGPKWHPWLNRLPGVRIDHILLTSELTATSHVVGPDTGSDHRPVIAKIGFAADPRK